VNDDGTYDLPVDMNSAIRPSFTVVTGPQIEPTRDNQVASLVTLGELKARYQKLPKGYSRDVGQSCCWHLEIINQFKCT